MKGSDIPGLSQTSYKDPQSTGAERLSSLALSSIPHHNNRKNERIPTLKPEIDNSTSMDLCALRMNDINPLQSSFYSQWEVDVDDPEERRIIEDLLGASVRFKHLGMTNGEGFMTPPMECLTPVIERPAQSIFEEEESQISEPALQQRPWQNLEPNIYDAFEKYLESCRQKNQDAGEEQLKKSQKFGLAWIYNSMGKKDTNIKEEPQAQQLCDQNIAAKQAPASSKPARVINKENVNSNTNNIDSSALTQKAAAETTDRPFRFNVMVIGQSGIGKSTFIDCFLERKYNVKTHIRASTTEVSEKEGVRKYKDMTFRINFVDTPGYKHDTDIRRWYREIRKYITNQFDDFKKEKNKQSEAKTSKRKHIDDKRIHMVLYFLSGARINDRDLYIMRKLKKLCNIVPVLARGDSYTVEEVKEIKTQLLDKAKQWKLEWFDFNQALKDEPQKLKQLNEGKFGPCPPFLIISSVKKIEISPDNYIYGREYSWGVCNAEDPNHSDFALLQGLLGGYICYDAILLTHNYCYKGYFERKKEKKRLIKEEGKIKNLGVGALCAFGLFGAYVMVKEKLSI